MKATPMTRDYSQFIPTAQSGAKKSPLNMLQKLGWQSFFAQQIDAAALAETPPVRVIEVHRSGLSVSGDQLDLTLPPRADVTVGDWLMLDQDHPPSSSLLDRKSLIKRRAAGTDRQVQLIAANIDTVFIVTSCNQDFNIARLERYIALAFDAEITPVIVLTKADQSNVVPGFLERARTISDRVEVLALDARGDAPSTMLAPWCKAGASVAFLGSSGVGKSTLANALAGEPLMQTAAVRADDDKGRHTTTRRQLLVLPSGCSILDSPGMRELQLADVTNGVEAVFADLTELAGQCRFNDCAHDTEPGCAIQAAVARGEVDAARVGRWQKLLAEDVFNALSMAERRSKDRAFGKMVRSAIKGKSNRT